MTEKELYDLAEQWQTKADRAMERYQETGLSRYNREREKAEDLAEAIRAAAMAADDRRHLISLRANVGWAARVADEALHLAGDKRAAKMDTLANNILSIARMEGIYG